MTPAESERLKWALVQLNEAAHQLRQARTDPDPDHHEITEARHEARQTLGGFIGMATIYTTPTEDHLAALTELAHDLHDAHQAGHEPDTHYGAVAGAINALTEPP